MSKLLPVLAVAGLAASPAAALTAPELWEDWQQTVRAFGSELTAQSQDYAGGRLALRGVTLGSEIVGESETVYGDISLVEQPDGSVRVEVPETLEMTSTSTVDGESETITILLRSEGLDYVVRDEGGARVYDASAARLSYIFEDVSGGAEEEPVPLRMTFTDLDSVTRLGEGDPIPFEGTLAAGLTVEAGAEGGPFTMLYEAQGLDGTVTGTLPAEFTAPEDGPVDPFALGLTYDFDMTHSGSLTRLTGTGPDGPFSYDGTSASGSLDFDLTETGIGYGLAATEVTMTVTPPGLPVPVNASAAELRTRFDLPLAQTGQPAPYAASVTLRELAVDEALWALFDPTGQLPRDPATLELALSGEAVVTQNIFDPEAMEEAAAPPALPRSLDLTTLLLRFAGAELRGSGELDFPNPQAAPLPVGTLTLELDGGFALLDKLVALGFVPPQQVAIIRGMAGAVAQQTGDDQLRSEIEFTEGGGVLANGMPLPF